MESALMIVPPSACASAKASADLPLAVGPAIRMACRASARLIGTFAVALGKNISPCNRRCVLSFTPLQGQIRELVKDDSWLVSTSHPLSPPTKSGFAHAAGGRLTLIRPFRALRPAPGRAGEILAPPYDVLSSAEARERAKGKPW